MGRELKRVAAGSEWEKNGGPEMDENPDYTPGGWYQMWQTVSDKPYTPAFETPEELAQWCADNPFGMEKSFPVSYETWLKFITGPGWAPTMMGMAGGYVTSGVEHMANVTPNAEIDIDLDRDFTDTVVEEITPEECEASECASHSDNRLVYFTAGDGTIHIHRRHSGDRIGLCPAEARELYLWLANSGIWSLK